MPSDRERALQYLKTSSEKATDAGFAGVMVIVADDNDTLTFGDLTDRPNVDPRMASLWMLGAHIQHVTESSRSAGGDVTMEEAASHAIAFIQQYAEE